MKKLKFYLIIITVIIVGCTVSAAVGTYYILNRSLESQSMQEVERMSSLNTIHRTLLLPVNIAKMMQNNSLLDKWLHDGEQPSELVHAYLGNIRETWGFDAFIASNITKNYYFSDGSVKQLTQDTADVEWFFYLLKENIESLVDVGYHNGDVNQPFLYVDYKLGGIDGETAGYVGTAVKLETFLVLLKKYRENYGIDLHFINKSGLIILSPDTDIINTKASIYPWYLKKQTHDSGSKADLGRYVSTVAPSLDITQNDISDIGWQLISVPNFAEGRTGIYDVAMKAVSFYSVFLLLIAVLLFFLYRRFRNDLNDAFAQIKTLKGIIPICCYCKKIRDDQGYWNQLEIYISKNSESDFSHGICPTCLKEQEAELYREIRLEE